MSDKNPNSSAGTARSHFNPLFGMLPFVLVPLASHRSDAAFAQPPPGQSVNLAWNSIPEIGIAGYRVHVGSESQHYSNSYEAGPSVSISIGGLEYGKTYYFAVAGLASDGTEGDLSNEIAVVIAPPPLPVGLRLSAGAGSQAALQWTFPKSAAGSSPEFVVYSSVDLVNWTKTATIQVSQSTGSDAQSLEFTWPFQTSGGGKKFFRITAQNWMGSSMLP